MAGGERERNSELILAGRMQKIVSKCLDNLQRKKKGALDLLDGVKAKDLATIAATLMTGSLVIKEKITPEPDGIFEMSRRELLAELTGKNDKKEEKQNIVEKSIDFESDKKEEKSAKNENRENEKKKNLKKILNNQ